MRASLSHEEGKEDHQSLASEGPLDVEATHGSVEPDEAQDGVSLEVLDDIHNSNNNNANNVQQKRQRRYECLICWIYFALCFIIIYAIPWHVHERPLPVQVFALDNDQRLVVRSAEHNQPLRGETVSDTALVLLCGLAPFVLQMWWCGCGNNSTLDRHATLCAYVLANATRTLATDALKLYCGYLRPVFFAICALNDAAYTAGTATDLQCTTTDTSELTDARKSFPSGHASQAWVGMMLLSLYLQRRWRVYDSCRPSDNNHPAHQQWNQTTRSLAALLPLVLAVWVSASRIYDNRHFPADVAVGTLLGGGIALYFHAVCFGRVK